MSLFGFVFLIIITVFINVFITAFLIARSHYSQKVLNRLRSEVSSIIRSVNKATEEHITIAESTIEDLKTLLNKQKRSSRSKINQSPKMQRPTQSKSATALVPTKRVKKSHATLTKKSYQSSESTQNSVAAMLKDGKSEAYIREHLNVSKAELTLARFMYKHKK